MKNIKYKGFLELENHSFAEGLCMYNKRGIIPSIRLNKQMKQIILTMVSESKQRTSTDFDDNEDDVRYNRFMESMEYLTQEITGKINIKKIKLNKRIGWTLSCFVWDNKFHHFASENEFEFENAMQWIISKINKKYSQFELTRWGEEIQK